ncbi:MAG TPA: diacylglycerol kinase family protein [Anaerolineae bacterium]|nr:diacylglycerol kinase family protein [Anaerolineae bacterium]
MASEKKARRKLERKFKEAQEEHDELLRKVEKSHTKFQKREQELRVLEARLAELERDYYLLHIPDQGQTPSMPEELRHARLIYNPKSAGNTNGDYSLESIVNCLRTHGIESEITIKTSSKIIRERAQEAAKKGEDLVVVAGGDGTIEKVAAQLVGSETTLGIIPTGTMNNLARSLGVPLDLNDACALIGMGVARKIDIGRVNVNEKAHIIHFLETAGLGLNAIAFPMGQDAKKGRWAGLPDALRKLFGFKPTPILVQLDDGQMIQANSQVITVSNAPLTGMNFLIAPEAKMDDGWLDVAIYDEMSKADLFAYLMAARNGSRAENPKIKRYKARRVQIRPRDPAPVVSDKDPLPENSNVDIQIIPQGLKVIVGKGIGLTFPVDVAPSVPPLSGKQQTNGHEQAEEAPAAAEATNG